MFASPYRVAPGHRERMEALRDQRYALCMARVMAGVPDRAAITRLQMTIIRLEGREYFDPTVPYNWFIAVPAFVAFGLILWATH